LKKKKDRETRLRDLRRARKRRRRRKPKRSNLAWLHWEYRDHVRKSTRLTPPSNWTLTHEPGEAVRYFLRTEAESEHQPVHHVLDDVKSLDLGAARLRLYNKLIDPPDPDVLLDEVFRGELGTRTSRSATRKANRGLGLPRMRDDARANRVQDLFVLTNSAYGIVASDRYQRLGADMSFPGTYLFWRILEKS